jgi:osmotically-inducible protein OsmY
LTVDLDGEVTVTGTVSTSSEVRAAEADAVPAGAAETST